MIGGNFWVVKPILEEDFSGFWALLMLFVFGVFLVEIIFYVGFRGRLIGTNCFQKYERYLSCAFLIFVLLS